MMDIMMIMMIMKMIMKMIMRQTTTRSVQGNSRLSTKRRKHCIWKLTTVAPAEDDNDDDYHDYK